MMDSKTIKDSMERGKRVSKPVDESKNLESSLIVGQDEYKEVLINKLTSDSSKRLDIVIIGYPGIGKTALAKDIFNDAHIKTHFPRCVWINASRYYKPGDISASIDDRVFKGSEEQLRLLLHQALHDNTHRYLVVIEDVWNQEIWGILKLCLPDYENRSRVLLTTINLSVARSVKSSGFCVEMKPLDEEDSWTLLRRKIFGDDKVCPKESENIGRRIASNCMGIPSTITIVAEFLSKRREDRDYWRMIEEDTHTDKVITLCKKSRRRCPSVEDGPANSITYSGI